MQDLRSKEFRVFTYISKFIKSRPRYLPAKCPVHIQQKRAHSRVGIVFSNGEDCRMLLIYIYKHHIYTS